MHIRARRHEEASPHDRLPLEFLAFGMVELTGHLGGFLGGVNV